MKKFKFRLERVLDYREQVEKEKQAALGKVHQLVVQHEQTLLEAYEVLEGARDKLRQAESKGEIDIPRARENRVYIGSLRRRISEVLKGLRKLEIELARCREETIQATKERKVLEMLKARQQETHGREVRKAERVELDDIAMKNEIAKRAGV